jgi:SAM-dependent methyltransferase
MAHGDRAALRGVPSYVWRAGQERRLQMVLRWAKLEDARVLDAGGGIGMYASQIRQRFSPHVELFEIELDYAKQAQQDTPHALVAAAEFLPYPEAYFDTVISNEVIEHVADDARAMREMIRVLRPGGRAVIFCPNRWYPFETHGHYWQGTYHFGNTPLINYLPDLLRDKLAPHVRAYSASDLQRLLEGGPVKVLRHQRIYGGYDNIIARLGHSGRILRNTLHALEGTPLDTWGLSHLLVLEKTGI